MTYKRSKLGETDLMFGLWSEFIRQVSAYRITSFYMYV